MARPCLTEADKNYWKNLAAKRERLVRLTRERTNLAAAITELDRQIAEELEKAQ